MQAAILGAGILEIVLAQRSVDFFRGDIPYVELARSIIESRSYEFNFRPETLLPPGLPILLAVLCLTVGCSYLVLVRAMAVFSTLGLMVTYELLRREERRAVAAVTCLLLASSPALFAFATRMVFSDLPYLFVSSAALLTFLLLDRAPRLGTRVLLWPLCGVLLVASQLIRSAGIALLVALAAWIVVSMFTERRAAARRLKTFLPLLLLGLMAQTLWMHWASTREMLEWPAVGGYPHSYFAQLTVKNGNQPELGPASLSDLPGRVSQNLTDRGAWLTELVTRKDYIAPVWFSPMVLGAIVLVIVGLGRSLRRRSADLLVWYFVAHEGMYLLWPWNFEERFFIPVAPLACLYLWRGGEGFLALARRRPRLVAAAGLLLAILLGTWAGTTALTTGGIQAALAAAFWSLGGLLSGAALWLEHPPWGRWWERTRAMIGAEPRLPVTLVSTLVATLVVAGVAGQIRLGRENLRFDLARTPWYADVEAGEWIRSHTEDSAVVMARQVAVVHHYSGRRVVWFPPLSDPDQLMQGIQKYRVDFVVVASRTSTYWLPAEADCFARLTSTYPVAFTLVHETARSKIFRTAPEPSAHAAVRGRSPEGTATTGTTHTF